MIGSTPQRGGLPRGALFILALVALLPRPSMAAPSHVQLASSAAIRADAVSQTVPVIQLPAWMTVDPGSTADQEIHATDADGDPLSFSKLDGPDYVTVTTTDPGSGAATGNIHLAPPVGTPAGQTYAVIAVSDGVTRGQTTVWILIATNPPILDPPADMTVAEGAIAEQQLIAIDVDPDSLSLFIVSGPPFATVTSSWWAPWVLRLAPGFADEGIYPVVVGVGDGKATDSKSLTITVTHTNVAPTLEQPADMTVNSGETADQVLHATDFDGEPLTFFKLGGPGFVTMTTMDPGTGSATGGVHVAPTIADATTPESSERYDVLAEVGDGTLLNTKRFYVTVNYPPDSPPVIDQPGDLSVVQGASAMMPLTGSDPDGDPVYFWKEDGPDFVLIRHFSGWVIQAYPTFLDLGSYLVVVGARDRRGAVDEASFHVIVTDGDEPPHIQDLRDMIAFTGQVTTEDFHAYDPEGNALTFTKSRGPAYMTVEMVNPGPVGATGRIRLAPSATDVGTASGGVLVSDGATSTDWGFGIAVHPPNVPVISPIFDMCISGIEARSIPIHAVDPEGDRLVYRQTGLPRFATLVDSGNGNASLNIAPPYDGTGGDTFATITVSDGTYEATDLFTIRAGPDWVCGRSDPFLSSANNTSPRARAGGPYSGVAGIPVQFDGSQSSDPDGTPIQIAWSFGDGTIGLGPTPLHTYARGSQYTVVLVVSDGYLSSRKTTAATIADAFAARAFTPDGQSRVRLSSGKPILVASVEPVNGSFQLADVDPATLVMVSPGTGSVERIAAVDRKGPTIEDTDANGIEEIRASFAQEDLRRLFGTVSGAVTAHVEGALQTGGIFRGDLTLMIIPTHGVASASVWPNPINPSGTLQFATTAPGDVTIRLFDLTGRLVRTLLPRQRLEAGEHTVTIDGRDSRGSTLATGVYFYRIEMPGGRSQGRFVVAK